MTTALKTAQPYAAPIAHATTASKASRLRATLQSRDLRFIMEAHNGLSAKIVEEAGFEGIWASGLSVSAALGVRDSNEASWTQVLDVLEFMADATSIPILVDGDTGYGNFNNFRRLVQKLCQRGIAGVCIEDKLFPKTNSFLGSNQPLADIDEFCGKIKAGKDSQSDEAFNIVARIEALISGWGMDEALRRAEAFHAAGADALVIHSKKSGADEIITFCREWGNRCPVIVIPTTYYRTPTERFREVGVSTVIWANHNLRVAIQGMREVCRRLKEEETLLDIEDSVAPLGDVFKLAGNAELEQAEVRYLVKHSAPRVVLLAASRGSELGDLTSDRPKCMLDVRGTSILERHVSALGNHGLHDVTVITGYKAETVDVPGITTVRNEAYETSGEAASLALAKDKLTSACIVGYGDIVYRHFILSMLLDCDADIAIVVDADWQDRRENGHQKRADLVRCSVPFATDFLDDTAVSMTDIGPDVAAADGEWIGLMKLSEKGATRVAGELEHMTSDGSISSASVPDVLRRLLDAGEQVAVVYTTGNWLDINDVFDLAQARNVT